MKLLEEEKSVIRVHPVEKLPPDSLSSFLWLLCSQWLPSTTGDGVEYPCSCHGHNILRTFYELELELELPYTFELLDHFRDTSNPILSSEPNLCEQTSKSKNNIHSTNTNSRNQ
jgi:hypothetical protein